MLTSWRRIQPGIVLAGTLGAAVVLASARRESPPHPADGAGLHVVVQPADCMEALETLNALGDLARARGVSMSGTLLSRGRGGPRLASEVEALFTFPLHTTRSDAPVRALRALGFERTPVVLVADAEGRLRSAFPGDFTRTSVTPADLVAHAETLLDLDP